MKKAVIEIRDLVVEVGDRRLLDIPALILWEGEHVAVLGPNGAGKSSLLKAVGGLLAPTRGHVSVLGRQLGGAGEPMLNRRQWRLLRAEVGQLMQGLHLVPRLTALENVVLGALARPRVMALWRSWLRCYPPALLQEASQALAELGLAQRLHVRADRLSGGERQKVSLARLRLQRARLILADEPTSALDPSATQHACQALLAAAQQASLLTVVHDPALLPMLAERVIGLKDGRLVFDVPIRDLNPTLLDRLYGSSASINAELCSCLAAAPALLTPSLEFELSLRVG